MLHQKCITKNSRELNVFDIGLVSAVLEADTEKAARDRRRAARRGDGEDRRCRLWQPMGKRLPKRHERQTPRRSRGGIKAFANRGNDGEILRMPSSFILEPPAEIGLRRRGIAGSRHLTTPRKCAAIGAFRRRDFRDFRALESFNSFLQHILHRK